MLSKEFAIKLSNISKIFKIYDPIVFTWQEKHHQEFMHYQMFTWQFKRPDTLAKGRRYH